MTWRRAVPCLREGLLRVYPGHSLEVAELRFRLSPSRAHRESQFLPPRTIPLCHPKPLILRGIRDIKAHRVRRLSRATRPLRSSLLPPVLLLPLQAAEGTKRLLGWVTGVLGPSGAHPKGGNQSF